MDSIFVVEVSNRNVSENMPKGFTNYPSVLRRLSFFELLEEEGQLTECAEHVARTRVIAQFSLCYHVSGIHRPEVFDPFGGVVHAKECFDVLGVGERGRIREFGGCLLIDTHTFRDLMDALPKVSQRSIPRSGSFR
jgi:hypothetical protein